MLEPLLKSEGPIGRLAFVLRVAGLALVGSLTGYALYRAGYHFLHFKTVGNFFLIVNWVVFGIAIFIQIMRRLQDLGHPSITFFIPFYNLYLLVLIFFAPGRSASKKD